MAKRNKKVGPLERKLDAGRNVEVPWDMIQDDFRFHHEEVAHALYQRNAREAPSHDIYLDEGVYRRKPKSDAERIAMSIHYGDISILTILEMLGQSKRFTFQKGKKRGKIFLEVKTPTAEVVFGYFWSARRAKLDEWRQFQQTKEKFDERGHAAQILALNSMLIFVGVKYSLPVAQQLGFVAGLAQEMAIFENFIPRPTWGGAGRIFLARILEVVQDWPDEGGFARPSRLVHLNAKSDPLPQPQVRKRHGKKRLVINPQRLAFYLTLSGYEGLRYLSGENPNEYVALVFRSERDLPEIVVLDTNIVGNCLFVLKGELADCLEVAGLTKSEICKSPVCVRRIIHQHNGSWMSDVELALHSSHEQPADCDHEPMVAFG